MRRLNAMVDPILTDLMTDLQASVEDTAEPWESIVEDAMVTAWDRLKSAQPTGEPDQG